MLSMFPPLLMLQSVKQSLVRRCYTVPAGRIVARLLSGSLGRLMLVLTMLHASASQAELNIEITQGKVGAIPIAVVPFAWRINQSQSLDMAAIVAADLQRTGLLVPLGRENMLSLPSQVGEVLFRDWQLLKQDYLLIGEVKPASGNDRQAAYVVEYALFDVVRQEQISRRRIPLRLAQLRDLAHQISDQIFLRLTGIRGVAATKLAYVSVNQERSHFKLQIADADGQREQTLFTSSQPLISPAWSPDAKFLAYTSFENGRSAIYTQEIASGKRRKIAGFRGINSAPAWSPDGRRLAMVLSKDGNPEIYMYDLKAGEFFRLTNHYGIDTEPAWAPDGQHILFTSDRGGKPQIYQVQIATGELRRLTFEGTYNARASISSDGRYLIMVHRREDVFHIASQDLQQGYVQVLTTETQLDESPSIAPNDSMLIYATKYRGRGILSVVSIDGSVKFRLPARFGEVREPAWSPFIN